MRTYGDNSFVRSPVETVALSGCSARRETQKTTPEGSEKRSIIVPTHEASVKGILDETEENLYFFRVLTAPALHAEDCDALYEAGCDDGTIVTRNRLTYIAFDRKADSLEEAIRSATANVRAAGFEVKRVEMPALV